MLASDTVIKLEKYYASLLYFRDAYNSVEHNELCLF